MLKPDPAVIYLRVETGRPPGAAEDDARAFAGRRGLTVAGVVTDPYGDADPCERAGWRRVRDMAAAGEIGTVIVRLPSCLAPEDAHEVRYREMRWLLDRGVRVRFSWPALTPPDGGAG
ncbi:recombinase family protein [Streptomyces sp. NPDC051207]|uniref:recombinase family protein n=1 Tax=Streptomyces sp. NPDC051207 TaxID=3154641 RepID=UPI0034459AAF